MARRRLSWRRFGSALLEAAGAALVIYVIIIGANTFSYFVTAAQMSFEIVGLHIIAETS